MNKSLLTSFINKYSLNGNIESVKWNVGINQIETKSMTDDKTILSFVTLKDNSGLEKSEIGINDTTKLQKLIGVLDDDIDISFNTYANKIMSINLKSEHTNVQYVTADISVIPHVAGIRTVPEFDFKMKLTPEFVHKFVKAKSALNDIDIVTFVNNNGQSQIVIGYSELNTNRISLDIEPIDKEMRITKTLHFNAKFLKEILISNSDCKDAIFNISNSGLAHVEFDTDAFNSNYYLITKQIY
jgi:hypothetical protein